MQAEAVQDMTDDPQAMTQACSQKTADLMTSHPSLTSIRYNTRAAQNDVYTHDWEETSLNQSCIIHKTEGNLH